MTVKRLKVILYIFFDKLISLNTLRASADNISLALVHDSYFTDHHCSCPYGGIVMGRILDCSHVYFG